MIFTIFLILIIVVLIRQSRFNIDKIDNSIIPDTNQNILTDLEPALSFNQTTRDNAMRHIEWSYRNNKPYEQFNFIEGQEKEFVVDSYQLKTIDQDGNIIDDDSGLMIFKIIDNTPQLVWELSSTHSGAFFGNVIRDITGDGVKEIIASWNDGKSETLYIISYDTNAQIFYVISPTHGIFSDFAGASGDININDLDNDGIPEITLSDHRNGVMDSKTYDFKYDIVYVAYKWDGKRYFLWKESKTPFSESKYFFDKN